MADWKSDSSLKKPSFYGWQGHKHSVLSPNSEQYVSLSSCHLVRFPICLRDPLENDACCCVFIKSSWMTADFISEHSREGKAAGKDAWYLFFLFLLCEYSDNCIGQHAQILKAAGTHMQFLFQAQFSSLSTKPQRASPCMSYVTYKIDNYIFQVNHSQIFFLPAPVQVEEESFTWHHMN